MEDTGVCCRTLTILLWRRHQCLISHTSILLHFTALCLLAEHVSCVCVITMACVSLAHAAVSGISFVIQQKHDKAK